jgi:hypothetical protein
MFFHLLINSNLNQVKFILGAWESLLWNNKNTIAIMLFNLTVCIVYVQKL